jgi:hypothetical protein
VGLQWNFECVLVRRLTVRPERQGNKGECFGSKSKLPARHQRHDGNTAITFSKSAPCAVRFFASSTTVCACLSLSSSSPTALPAYWLVTRMNTHWLRLVLSLCLWLPSQSTLINKYNVRSASRSTSRNGAHDRRRVHTLQVEASVNALSIPTNHQVQRRALPRRNELEDNADDTVWEHKFIGATLRNWMIALGCFLVTLLTCFNIFTVFSHIWSWCHKNQRNKEEGIDDKKPDDAVVSKDECSSTSPSSPDVEDPIPLSP